MRRNTLRIYLAAVAAAGMAFCAPTEAKLVGSGFDPTLFDGTGFFFVPDAPSPCLTLPDGFNFVNGENDCTGVMLVSVTVNVDDQEGNKATLTLGSPSDLIIGMVIDSESNPVVVGMDTNLIALNCTNITGNLCADQWFIEWSSGLLPPDPVTLFREFCDGDCSTEQFGDPAIHVTFFNPEPGSLALLGGGLIAGWVARRRKSRR